MMMMDQTTVPGVVQQGEKLQGDGWPCLGKYSMLTQSFKLQCSALQKGMHNTVHVHAGKGYGHRCHLGKMEAVHEAVQ